MKKMLLFLGCSLLLLSCSRDSVDTVNIENTPVSGDIDMPNPNTKTEFIQTADDPKNEGVFSQLVSDANGEKFELQYSQLYATNSFYDPDTETQFILKGTGLKAYKFKRTEAKPEGYYPDFIVTVFEFNSELAAEDCYTKIKAALHGGKFANGKEPHALVRNGMEVYYLSTRAEMFRGYIDDFAGCLEGY